MMQFTANSAQGAFTGQFLFVALLFMSPSTSVAQAPVQSDWQRTYGNKPIPADQCRVARWETSYNGIVTKNESTWTGECREGLRQGTGQVVTTVRNSTSKKSIAGNFSNEKGKFKDGYRIGWWQSSYPVPHGSEYVHFEQGHLLTMSNFVSLGGEYTIDRQGKWVQYREGAKNGWEVLGSSFYSLGMPEGYMAHLGERAERGAASIHTLLDTDFSATHPAFAGLFAGERYKFRLRLEPLQLKGKRVGLIVSNRLLTQHKRLQEDLARVSPVFANSPKRAGIQRLSALVAGQTIEAFSLALAQQGATVVAIQDLSQIKSQSLNYALLLDMEYQFDQAAMERMPKHMPGQSNTPMTFTQRGFFIEPNLMVSRQWSHTTAVHQVLYSPYDKGCKTATICHDHLLTSLELSLSDLSNSPTYHGQIKINDNLRAARLWLTNRL